MPHTLHVHQWERSIQTRDERLHDVLETPGGSTKQASQSKKGKDTKGTQTTRLQVNKETVEFLKVKTSQTRDATMMEDMFHLRGISQQ
jgi:hypothetical protein